MDSYVSAVTGILPDALIASILAEVRSGHLMRTRLTFSFKMFAFSIISVTVFATCWACAVVPISWGARDLVRPIDATSPELFGSSTIKVTCGLSTPSVPPEKTVMAVFGINVSHT